MCPRLVGAHCLEVSWLLALVADPLRLCFGRAIAAQMTGLAAWHASATLHSEERQGNNLTVVALLALGAVT